MGAFPYNLLSGIGALSSIFFVLGYIASCISYWKQAKKLRNPLEWMATISKVVMGSLRLIKTDANNADSKFMDVDYNLHLAALNYASGKMVEEGHVSANYVYCLRDCENYAQAQKHHYDTYIANMHGSELKGFGIPSEKIGYFIGGNRKRGHSIVEYVVDGKIEHWDVYPRPSTELPFDKIEMSGVERKSIVRGITKG